MVLEAITYFTKIHSHHSPNGIAGLSYKAFKFNLCSSHFTRVLIVLCCVPQYENPGTLRTRIYTFHMILINLTNAVNKRTQQIQSQQVPSWASMHTANSLRGRAIVHPFTPQHPHLRLYLCNCQATSQAMLRFYSH